MSQKRPCTFIIGAPKCGTTALASYLAQHPNIVVSNPKEPLFFCEEFPNIRKFQDEKHYLTAFKDYKQSSCLIDASVWYLYSEKAIENIKKYCPNAKIIIGVREPTKFMYSLFLQHKFGGAEDKETFFEAWNLKEERRNGNGIPRKCKEPFLIDYEELAKFSKYVKKWIKAFEEKNVYIYSLEELSKNPKKIYSDVLQHLGVREWFPDSYAVVNSSKKHRYKFVQWILHSRIFRSGWHIPIKKKLGIASFGIYERIRTFNIENKKEKKEDMRAYEIEFEKSNKELFQICNRELW